MKKLLLLLSFIAFVTVGFSQGPFPPIIDVPNLDCDSSQTIYLHTQAQVDSFPINYGLSTIPGCIEIGGLDVLNVDSLYQITQINGSLIIGTLVFCFPPPCVPVPEITDLTGLSNLNTVNGVLVLRMNVNLTDLTGLENINPESLSGLFIQGNNSLSQCSIESICGYIDLDSANVDIQNNAMGCDTVAEVEAGCLTNSIEEVTINSISIYPNPTSTFIHIDSKGLIIKKVRLYNQLGQSMPVYGTSTIDVANFPKGIYVVEVESDNGIYRERIVVE